MRVVFVERENGPERLVCEAEIVFDDPGPLHGMKLVGFSLWRGPDGEVYVTFPSRAFGAGNDRKYFDYLRSAEGDPKDAKAVKAWIAEEYRATRGAEQQEAPPASAPVSERAAEGGKRRRSG